MANGTKRGFDYMWEGVIAQTIDFCVQEIDKDFFEKAEVEVASLNKYKMKLRESYHKKREWLKIEYLPHKYKPILDFHKLSAIICRCIIGFKPVAYNENIADLLFLENQKQIFDVDERKNADKKLKWQIENIYVNYRIAFLSAAGLAYDDLLCWIQRKIKNLTKKEKENVINPEEKERLNIYNQFRDSLIENSALIQYRKSPNHDDFESSMIVSLMKNDMLKRDFDYLSFAAILFQWQENTKEIIFSQILRNPKVIYQYYNLDNFKEIYDLDIEGDIQGEEDN